MITCVNCGREFNTNVEPIHCSCGVSSNVPFSVSCEYNHWAPLHYYAVKRRENWDRVSAYLWYWNEWVPNIPKSCGCKEKWIELDLEPDFSTPKAFFEWAYNAHDRINAQLGKTYRPSLAECYAIWCLSNGF